MSSMAIRLNWNPQRAPGDVSPENIEDLARDGVAYIRWRCGQATIELGQRVFLVRTGRDPRGVIGMGRAVSERDGGYTTEDGEWVPYSVVVCFEILSLEPIVPRETLDLPPLDTVAWSNATAAALLDPDQAKYLERLILNAEPDSERPAYELMDVEAFNTEDGDIAARDTGEFVREESALVQRFVRFKRKQGCILKAVRFQPPGWPGSVRCDMYDPATRTIFEAKSECDRHTIRVAIGQLADYARLHGEPCNKVLLVPRPPHRDLSALLESQGISVVWEEEETFVASRGMLPNDR